MSHTPIIRYTTKGFSKKDMKFIKVTLDDERGMGHSHTFRRCQKPYRPDVAIRLTPRKTMVDLFGDYLELKGLSVTDRGVSPKIIYIDELNWYHVPKLFKGTRTVYRQYLIQHEMGHCLGLDHVQPIHHENCPVMYQQTRGTQECRANPWITMDRLKRHKKTPKKTRKKTRFVSQ